VTKPVLEEELETRVTVESIFKFRARILLTPAVLLAIGAV
jgi:hypothetical protein